eukprot:4160879-Amphidinium_carterae.1
MVCTKKGTYKLKIGTQRKGDQGASSRRCQGQLSCTLRRTKTTDTLVRKRGRVMVLPGRQKSVVWPQPLSAWGLSFPLHLCSNFRGLKLVVWMAVQ